MLNYLQPIRTGERADYGDKVENEMEMWANVGGANGAAVTDASVRVDCACEVA